MPRWFRILFAIVMLCACTVIAFCTVDAHQLRLQTAEIAGMLDTSRQREVKQQYEYDEAAAALPDVLARVAELEPQAAAAKETEAALRALRKQLRADNTALAEQLSQVQADVAQARQTADALASELGETAQTLIPLLSVPARP